MNRTAFYRRCVAFAVACSLVGAPGAAAAAPADDVEKKIEGLLGQSRFAEAAELARAELDRVPESHDSRNKRNAIVALGVTAYESAFAADTRQCATIQAGIELADRYLSDLLAVYGGATRNADGYVGVAERRGELDKARASAGCPEPVVEPGPKPVTEPAGPGDPPQPETRAEPRLSRPLLIGVGVSAGLTVVMVGASLGMGLSRLREPFTGPAYDKIYDAAKASFEDDVMGNEVAYGDGADMCKLGAEVKNADVTSACDTWNTLGKATIATAVLAGVFAVTTISLTAVMLRKRQKERTMALLRTHQPFLGAAPGGRGGLNVSLGFRF